MKKVVVYIAMSLDGYIADKDGSVAWLAGDGSDPENMGSYPQFIETIDRVILGYKTYEQIATELSPNVWPYAGMTSYVITHRQMEDTEEVRFISEPIEELIERVKKEDGKNIWICGGGSIINQLHKLNLIDEYAITIIPTILGGGTKLFEQHDVPTKLRLKSTQHYNGMVDLVYERA